MKQRLDRSKDWCVQMKIQSHLKLKRLLQYLEGCRLESAASMAASSSVHWVTLRNSAAIMPLTLCMHAAHVNASCSETLTIPLQD